MHICCPDSIASRRLTLFCPSEDLKLGFVLCRELCQKLLPQIQHSTTGVHCVRPSISTTGQEVMKKVIFSASSEGQQIMFILLAIVAFYITIALMTIGFLFNAQ